MYEFYPYFTNDGSVGLYSQKDDDIYHSTYGAVTESWQKFIFPSHLSDFIKENKDVRILDICYGIGYNTKTALQVFVENYFKNYKKNNQIKSKNKKHQNKDIAAIDTDNILTNINSQNEEKYNKSNNNKQLNIEAIHTDNIPDEKNENFNNNFSTEHDKSDYFASILIDAVDIDKNLIGLSPFIRIRPKRFLWDKVDVSSVKHDETINDKLNQILKINRVKKTKLKKELKLKKEVSMLLLLKLLEINFDFNDKIIQTILDRKKFTPYLSRYMLSFFNFYQNLGYYYDKNCKICTFLHNIYYRYVSASYKRVKNILDSCKINVHLFDEDARSFVKTSANTYNFIFLDAFTPSKCPTLWSYDFFLKLFPLLSTDGMILTYSNSAAIRSAFIKAGFSVGKIYDETLDKFVGTIATKNSQLIEHPLDDHDLGLINSKAGICFRDENLDLDNAAIIANRQVDVENSNLISSSQYLKGKNSGS